ncbi:chemotaxis protein CheB [Dyella jiangningensis]|uniref:protein-glutamate methylesterase n=2 Tax=Dyella jiangningensis TaxID=1379159 RepID=A0A328P7R8_9GAMM|nr:chemotaxis protein CheB [Dyella jiangningensis]
MQTHPHAGHDVVVIGGSMGAAEPLRTILADMPTEVPAAFFVILHMAARSSGILRTVTSAISHLPVHVAEDGMAFQHGHVYLAVPDHHLLLTAKGLIRLGTGPRENMSRPAIDALFRSAAAAAGPRVIGVLLSGLLSDGVAGLDAIKRCGGLAMVQDPIDATASSMPRSALQTIAVDRIAPAALLGGALCELIAQPAGAAAPVPGEILTEVAIAAGAHTDVDLTARVSSPSPLTCPSCGGVLSTVNDEGPLRYRCQIGHGMTADVLESQQRKALHRALAVALRTIEERVALVKRMAADHRANDRLVAAESYDGRAEEYGKHIEVLRHAIASSTED